MRLLIDGVALASPSAQRGVGTYLRALLDRLPQYEDLAVEVLVRGETALPAGVARVAVRRRLPPVGNFFEQALRLPGDVRRVDPDVFHSPALDPPRRCATPWVQTLLDVIPLAVPHREFWLRKRMWQVRGSRMRAAAAVIAISRSTADDGIRQLGLDPSLLHVVHLGVDPGFEPPPTRDEPDPPYLLSVSGYGPHKGFREAFELMQRLRDDGFPHRLKVVGHVGRSGGPIVRAMLSRAGSADRVDLLGFVPTEELRVLYQRASLVVVTSRYEGFCLPAVEAMASGTPVVAFANSALPEVLGDAGVLVRDGDVGAFAAAARELLTVPSKWNEESEAGLARAAHFDWSRSAREHVDILRDVANR